MSQRIHSGLDFGSFAFLVSNEPGSLAALRCRLYGATVHDYRCWLRISVSGPCPKSPADREPLFRSIRLATNAAFAAAPPTTGETRAASFARNSPPAPASATRRFFFHQRQIRTQNSHSSSLTSLGYGFSAFDIPSVFPECIAYVYPFLPKS